MAYDFTPIQLKLQKSLDHVRSDIAPLRTGRSSVQLLDPVRVEAYGTNMSLNEVASISAPDPQLLIVSPWDKSLLTAIEKAIASAGINLNPIVDGDIIRIVIAPLTEEKRKEYVKLLHQKIEAGRVMVRNIRTDGKKEIEQQEGTAGISEDDVKFELDQLEEEIKSTLSKLDSLAESKERELLQI